MCVHDYECAVKGDKCCQAVMSGGDGVMLLRCGPWLDYSGYTGAVNGYMYKCEDEVLLCGWWCTKLFWCY